MTGYLAEIEDATGLAELESMGPRMKRAQRSRELSPASYEKVAVAAATRMAKLREVEPA